jgi:hypothetical protein
MNKMIRKFSTEEAARDFAAQCAYAPVVSHLPGCEARPAETRRWTEPSEEGVCAEIKRRIEEGEPMAMRYGQAAMDYRDYRWPDESSVAILFDDSEFISEIESDRSRRTKLALWLKAVVGSSAQMERTEEREAIPGRPDAWLVEYEPDYRTAAEKRSPVPMAQGADSGAGNLYS